MNLHASDLNALVWLVATQFLLYAVGWGLCSLLLREQRAALLHWGAFMLAVGLGFVMASQRGEPRHWWAFNGSNLAFIFGYVALRRGLEHFSGQRRRDGEHLVTLLLSLLLFSALGPGLDQAPWRVIGAYGIGVLVLLRAVWVALPAVREEFGPRLVWILGAPALMLIAGFTVRVAQQVLDTALPLEMQGATDSNRRMLFSYLVGAALFNFSFVGLVTTRLLGRLREQARLDPLTGLLNRRALEHEVQLEWQRLRRGGPGFAVLAVDLDHFKRVNDSHGHPAGDSVLVQTATRLRQAMREIDIVARTGGEEFVVLVPRTGLPGALAAAERLRRSISGEPFDWVSQPLAVTASIGVSVTLAGDASVGQVLQRADRALYAAKAEGRDRVSAAEPVVAAG